LVNNSRPVLLVWQPWTIKPPSPTSPHSSNCSRYDHIFSHLCVSSTTEKIHRVRPDSSRPGRTITGDVDKLASFWMSVIVYVSTTNLTTGKRLVRTRERTPTQSLDHCPDWRTEHISRCRTRCSKQFSTRGFMKRKVCDAFHASYHLFLFALRFIFSP
jgi:hypothetical protein